MALTYSQQQILGQSCPEFSLKDVNAKTWQKSDLADGAVFVVMFICNHCPYVKAIEDRLLKLAQDFEHESVRFVAICSNDWADHAEDHPDKLKSRWLEKQYPFPYLIDDTQSVAKAFGAVCTPDLFVYDKGRKLAYRGRLDDSWRKPELVKREELKEAIVSLLHGQEPRQEQIPSMGCSIKWKTQ